MILRLCKRPRATWTRARLGQGPSSSPLFWLAQLTIRKQSGGKWNNWYFLLENKTKSKDHMDDVYGFFQPTKKIVNGNEEIDEIIISLQIVKN